MNKLLSFFACLLAVLAASAGNVVFDFSTEQGLNALGITAPGQSQATNLNSVGKITLDGVSLTATDGSTSTRVWNSQGSYTLRVYVDGTITFSVASGSITGIRINAANSSNFDFIASIGDYKSTSMTGTWTGSAASVTFTHTGSKNAQVASVEVTTSTADPDDKPIVPTVDPTKVQVDSLHNIYNLEDGTEFQMWSEVYVNYQFGNYLWVYQLDDEGYTNAALIFGKIGKTYELGDVIPAGWTGRMSNYVGQIEVESPDGFGNAVDRVDEFYYSPFDMTGYLDYLIDPEEGWECYKIIATNLTLSDIDGIGNFTFTGMGTGGDVTVAGYNKFGIAYPENREGSLYTLEGMVTIRNDKYQIYPIAISECVNETRLWKLPISCEEGVLYTLADTLYVAGASNGEDGKLIYVTDNATSIYYDEYADLGYAWYQDWYPTWATLDCGDDQQLFESLASAGMIAPSTVKGILRDPLATLTLELVGKPVPVAEADQEPIINEYDITQGNMAFPMGSEVCELRGYYRNWDGEQFICSKPDGIYGADDDYQYPLDFSYLNSQASITDGQIFTIRVVAKMDHPWEDEDFTSVAPAKAKKRVMPRALQPRRNDMSDGDYCANYTMYVLGVELPTGIDTTSVARRVAAVKYVSTLGVTGDKPFDGINVVITTYTDGTTTTTKVVK
ncbi:MAG: hypothetical protein KBT10_08990 [Bacteroidales bacterium]|nr:hypothetical protein [Candidatus Sodaliphilus aphodohippi]